MRFIFLVLLSLLSSPALATIDAWNDDSDQANRVYVRVQHELVGNHVVNHAGVVTIPPRAFIGQFHVIYVHTDGATAGFVVAPLRTQPIFPPGHIGRPVSIWGTEPGKAHLTEQVQTDRHVQFSGDYAYDADFNGVKEGKGIWYKRGPNGGWPNGYVSAIYVRGLAGGKTGGNGQINFAARCVEGTTSNPGMQMRGQVRGFSSAGNTDAVEDHVRVVISRGDGHLCVLINGQSNGGYLLSGYELMF